jgi:hypothetical protein
MKLHFNRKVSGYPCKTLQKLPKFGLKIYHLATLLQISDVMFNDMPDGVCSGCLPDCTTTVYRNQFNESPFRPKH